MKLTVKVNNSALTNLIKDLPRRVDRLVDGHAQRILEVAVQEVPVKTGRLKASGHIEPIPGGKAVVFDTPYAQVVHNGGAHRPANPWLRRAVSLTKPDLDTAITQLKASIGE